MLSESEEEAVSLRVYAVNEGEEGLVTHFEEGLKARDPRIWNVWFEDIDVQAGDDINDTPMRTGKVMALIDGYTRSIHTEHIVYSEIIQLVKAYYLPILTKLIVPAHTTQVSRSAIFFSLRLCGSFLFRF